MFGQADRVQFTPPPSVRPFDRERQGTILGEGAAAVVLRREAEPGRPVRGWLRSVAVNCDAHHPTAPDRAGVTASVLQAQRAADITPAEIDLVVLHGTGTPVNDLLETEVTAAVFGDSRPALTGIKAQTGHTSGSAGLMSLLVALSAIATGRIPAVAGLVDPLPEAAELRLIRDTPALESVSTAQVNGFGFGGVNAVAIVAGAA